MTWRWAPAAALAATWLGLTPAALHGAEPVRHGPTTCAGVALTFDLCPVSAGPGLDAPLIDYLTSHHVPATFFASGTWMAGHEPEVRRLLAEPNFELGTHGEAHRHMTTLDPAGQRAELAGPVAWLAQHFQVHPTLFRPPFGELDQAVARVAAAEGQTVVLWSVVSGDPDPKLAPDRIVDEVVRRSKNGAIVVFHANGRGWHTRDVVPVVHDRLAAKGLAFLTVSGLTHGCAAPALR